MGVDNAIREFSSINKPPLVRDCIAFSDKKIKATRKNSCGSGVVSTKFIIKKRDLSYGIPGFLFMQRN